MLTIQVKTQQ